MTRPRRRSKYGVDLTQAGRLRRTYKGRVYASLKEMLWAMRLDAAQAEGTITGWQYEKRLTLTIVPGAPTREYRPDFTVTYPDGHVELHEIKGKMTPYASLKYWVFEQTWLREHPDVIFRINPEDP